MTAISIRQRFEPAVRKFIAAAVPWASRWRKELIVAWAMILTVVAPFLLRPASSTTPSHYDRRLVIITPHHDRIRHEFAQAFAKHWKDTRGETLFIDWRVPGGTSEIAMFLKSEFSGAFQYHWETVLRKSWSGEVAGAFLNAKLALPVDSKSPPTPEHEARIAFLQSNIGVGIDLFFGGGAYDFIQQAENGILVSGAGEKPAGITAVRAKHPAWFGEASIPEKVSGEPFADKDNRWVGTCLSSFGIVFNRDVLRRLGIEEDPTQWSDLADPRLFNQVALADPTKSGSVTKAFEMIIQQQMQREISKLRGNPGKLRNEQEIITDGVKRGWEEGFKLIQAITANARYFADGSTKIPLEVARGDAAAGMCIDYYGRTAEDDVRRGDGTSRVGFIAPVGGTSIGVDPIGLMRGAPEPEVATAFIEFVLGDEGQKLWSYKPIIPGGPRKTALRRLPVRKDFYSQTNLPMMTDASELPYEKTNAFVYEDKWTSPLFNAIRFLIRVTCIDVHEEQQQAWRELIDADMPPRAKTFFFDTKLISYETTKGSFMNTLRSRDKVQEINLARKLSGLFRANYDKAAVNAREGR